MTEIYLDHAATTPLDPRVLAVMQPYFSTEYGNPGSPHKLGMQAKEAIEHARTLVATVLCASPQEIIFCSSGTESVNLAIKGVALTHKKGHIVTSVVEHPAVLETCKYLERVGFTVTYLPVDKFGMVSVTDLEKAIRKDTILVSLMYANNEIGTLNPIKELTAVARKHHVLFHSDACQAGSSLNINVDELGVDLLTLNGSKIYGPKGSGVLYVRSLIGHDIPSSSSAHLDGGRNGIFGQKGSHGLLPLIHGGGQEFGLRSGTENVAAIAGFAKALELVQQEKEQENPRLLKLRDRLIEGLLARVPKTQLNGHRTERLVHNVNVTFSGVDGAQLLELLSEQGIYASAGSACTSFKLEPSHVILALGVPVADAHGTIRFSLGKQTTDEDIQRVLDVVPKMVEELRGKVGF